jgi:hypothetical protein
MVIELIIHGIDGAETEEDMEMEEEDIIIVHMAMEATMFQKTKIGGIK